MTRYQNQIQNILENAEKFHVKFYKEEKFGGPCLYFHRRSIEYRKLGDSDRYLEYVYATLTSWGMHRMGRGGGKMVNFDVFKQSVAPLWNYVKQAESIGFVSINDPDWKILEGIFKSIKIMVTGTSLVGNSKVMAHLIPNIIPPIDREYTLNFLRGNTNIQNGLDREWKMMKEIIEEFFIPIAKDAEFSGMARQWISNQVRYPWDTSIFKVVDNLIMAAS